MRLRSWSGRSIGSVVALSSLAAVLAAGCGSFPTTVPPIASKSAVSTQAGPQSIAQAATTAAPVVPGTPTPTAGEFALDLTPLPSATAIPTLVLPTESKFAGAFEVWDGLPTYLADSQPGFYFRVSYDPAMWANTFDAFGAPALANRSIGSCIITPSGGRGLPLNGTVDHDVRKIGEISFQISTAYVNGARQFVNYVGGDGVIYTGFRVAFTESGDECLSEAESVLGTLRAVVISDATPIPRP